mmetsp:Transcript_90163/g.156246  ORF Transcript_90163/g.156246 Transcript_90163/m.156246 type:complete len:216 (-) Transcript_90163:293-940(-)
MLKKATRHQRWLQRTVSLTRRKLRKRPQRRSLLVTRQAQQKKAKPSHARQLSKGPRSWPMSLPGQQRPQRRRQRKQQKTLRLSSKIQSLMIRTQRQQSSKIHRERSCSSNSSRSCKHQALSAGRVRNSSRSWQLRQLQLPNIRHRRSSQHQQVSRLPRIRLLQPPMLALWVNTRRLLLRPKQLTRPPTRLCMTVLLLPQEILQRPWSIKLRKSQI